MPLHCLPHPHPDTDTCVVLCRDYTTASRLQMGEISVRIALRTAHRSPVVTRIVLTVIARPLARR